MLNSSQQCCNKKKTNPKALRKYKNSCLVACIFCAFSKASILVVCVILAWAVVDNVQLA